jgi:hypothetical protein
MVCFYNTGCIKTLLEKKIGDKSVDDSNKYAGFWKATSAAIDMDGDRVLDENEKTGLSGTSELRLNSNKQFTFFLKPNSGSSADLSGNWEMNGDKKSVTIKDNTNGNLRFDAYNDNEMRTEPLTSNGSTIWLIYQRQ